ncbi:mucoidy inhibitor MuiA family protein [Thiolinea disciformis]|uniref:mucoidy inhibitor MuiA family protein n=1 Tax=Thiolinea disciformis TaxID=125614 RepID=UPI00037E0F38|nr:mucoidy inhibitor MuiA family protein [Thiolinea disciformis]
MIKLRLPICLLALTTLFPAWSYAGIAADSTIAQVVVYPDSARITRLAKIAIPSGESQITLAGLPVQLDADSLRVSGQGSAPVSLGSVQLVEQLSAQAVQEREKQLQEEIRLWEAKRQEMVDAQARAKQQLEFIRATGLPKTDDKGESASVIPVEQWQQAWRTLEIATAEAQANIRAADQSLLAFDRGLEKLRKELAQIATGSTSTRSAILYVNAQAPSDLTLNIHYQIQGASWRPVYEADLDSKTSTIKLKTQAEIQQTTGEDWSEVQVNLSTLRPASGQLALPELNSWSVGLYDEHLAQRPSAADAMAAAEGDMANQAVGGAMEKSAVAVAPAAPIAMQEISSLRFTTDYQAEYQAPGKLSLNSGSDSRRLTLTVQKLASTLGIYSVPRLDPRAFVRAETTYEGNEPLIAGPVSLYRDGNFIGNSQLASVLKGELVKLDFGEDNLVKLKFQPSPESTHSSGIINSRKSLQRQYLVTMANQHEDARNITLYDVIPTSDTDQITINMLGDRPSEQNVDNKKGVMSWVREVSAGSSDQIEYGYVVSYPEDKDVSGL